MQQVRGDKIALIFQEPMSSLNPLHKIGRQIAETLTLHRGFNGRRAKAEVLRLLKMTGIKNAVGGWRLILLNCRADKGKGL